MFFSSDKLYESNDTTTTSKFLTFFFVATHQCSGCLFCKHPLADEKNYFPRLITQSLVKFKVSSIIKLGRFFTCSKVFPIYKPTIPKTVIIIPDKNQIEIIRLA